MKDNEKLLCVIISVLLLYLVYDRFLREHFQNMLVGQVQRRNNPENNIPLFYR
tara:strand:- start:1602 stop:1760 length:159 start_codon:yes stop_codon:yes gene_type:complete